MWWERRLVNPPYGGWAVELVTNVLQQRRGDATKEAAPKEGKLSRPRCVRDVDEDDEQELGDPRGRRARPEPIRALAVRQK